MVKTKRRKKMNLKNLFILNAVVCLVFGLSFVFVPVQTLSLYGDDIVHGQFKYVGQLFGSALLVFSLASWLVRNAAESTARSAIILSFFIGDVIGFVISLINQIGGVVNALNWSTVAIYLLLALGFGYFQFLKPSNS
jgi:hypothetical protein